MVKLYFIVVTLALLVMAGACRDTSPYFSDFCILMAGVAFGEILSDWFDEEDEGR